MISLVPLVERQEQRISELLRLLVEAEGLLCDPRAGKSGNDLATRIRASIGEATWTRVNGRH